MHGQLCNIVMSTQRRSVPVRSTRRSSTEMIGLNGTMYMDTSQLLNNLCFLVIASCSKKSDFNNQLPIQTP
jgi:hypothetical protein